MNSELREHMTNRLEEIRRLKAGGRKVIGHFPGSYVPDEIIYASGAIPVCLAAAGDITPVERSSGVIPRNFCSFVRAQVGEKLLGRDPYLGLVDLVVAPVACQHLKKLAEIWEYDADIPLVKVGVPLANTGVPDLDYYAAQLRKVMARLSALTGTTIDGEKLSEAICLYNRMREAFRKVGSLRRSDTLPIDSLEFMRLQHVSFRADPQVTTTALESMYAELSADSERTPVKRPRLLLMGPNLCEGDYKVIDLVGAADGSIVVEFIDEGVRNYWKDIDNTGDPVESLARGYLRDRIPCAFMVESAKSRLEFALELVVDYSVSGAVWYGLRGCETYDSESYWFARQLESRGIPMLVLESDYGTSDVGTMQTRIEAFLEMVKGV